MGGLSQKKERGTQKYIKKMPGGKSLCEHESSDEHSNEVEVVPLIFLFPLQFSFALFFLRQLYLHTKIDSRNSMVIATIIYVSLTVLVSLNSFYNEVLEPIRQTKFSPNLTVCRISTFLEWTCAGLQLWSLVEVFLCRLNSVFKGSTNEVSPFVRWSFRTVYGTVITVAFSLSVFRIVQMDCFVEKSYGFLAKTKVFPKYARHCESPPKYQWMRIISVMSIAVIFTSSVIILLYMFVSRLRKLDQMGLELGIDNMIGFQHLIDKSCFITFVGLTSTLFSLVLAANTGYSAVIYTDILLNNVLLYMLFSFGDDLFDSLFGWIIRSFRKPRRPLMISRATNEDPTPRQMTTATLSDVEDDEL